MKEITIGKELTFTHTVKENELAYRIGSGDVAVFATPMMIAQMEHAASLLLQEFLDEGETSVGVLVNTTHEAATPCGRKVSTTAVIRSVEGKKVSFQITSKDELHTIGVATHERVIVDKAKFETRAKG